MMARSVLGQEALSVAETGNAGGRALDSSFTQKVEVLRIREPRTREHFLQYSRQLTLDTNTANRLLRLSEGNSQGASSPAGAGNAGGRSSDSSFTQKEGRG
ncbi:hypothetical protein AAFF_G00281700 [Aldrovandia affinis]|uniref:Uncharacterized protein n=1 Tax=Aldrovandia affinis TaxID=143900 RepID=A0AAD7R9R2_9TELE|nr:hypothetical protein AAFF_G00281700 [Aldrovandia affinis]